MEKGGIMRIFLTFIIIFILCCPISGFSADKVSKPSDLIYKVEHLKSVDSQLKVHVGELAPEFSLKSINGKNVSLSDFKGISNVVLSFIPSAWTPVCSGQWAGYNIVMDTFKKYDTALLGISVDNVATLYSWTKDIGGMKFEILSDFWPHGKVADAYGVLRSDGTADRSLFFINKEGRITGVIVSDINSRPPLEDVFSKLEQF